MSDDPVLAAVQKFMDAVESRIQRQDTEIRSLRDELQTRSAPPTVVEGPPGKDGRDGKDGADGKPGENGKDGVDGKDGAPGERGADGLAGRDGKDGIDGRNGADGIATREELESLVTSEVSRAVADVQVRTFADIYTGTYQVGSTYTRGLLATWGGSLWLSNVQTTKKPGDNNADWTLIVKRGADAKR